MRIALASDHAGFEQKLEIASFLTRSGHDVLDKGPDSDKRCDYPDFALAAASAVASGQADRGVLVCGTGIGMALAADKVAGIRAAAIHSEQMARLSREHNDLNVLCLSGRFVDFELNERIVDVFLNTKFEGGRHALRIAKVMALDDDSLPFRIVREG